MTTIQLNTRNSIHGWSQSHDVKKFLHHVPALTTVQRTLAKLTGYIFTIFLHMTDMSKPNHTFLLLPVLLLPTPVHHIPARIEDTSVVGHVAMMALAHTKLERRASSCSLLRQSRPDADVYGHSVRAVAQPPGGV